VEVIRVDPLAPAPEAIRKAAELLAGGGLVAFPTETVYGLGGMMRNPAAVARIYAAKGRPDTSPLILHLPDVAAVRKVVSRWPHEAAELARRFWPGPLTLVLPRGAQVPDTVTGGLDTVGVRIPSHPVALALLRAVGEPVAAPSANPFTGLSPTAAAHVVRGLGNRVDLILDGGPTPRGIESTVVALEEEGPVLLRPGALATHELEGVVGPLRRLPHALDPSPSAPSPGMSPRHYAPRARLRLFSPGDPTVVGEVEEIRGAGGAVGGLLLSPFPGGVDHPVPMPGDPAAYERLLYATLHSLDEQGCELILAERVPEGAGWEGVRDRLQRGSHPG